MKEFLSLKELHRPPPLPRGQTSPHARYITANTTAAQRLRAVGLSAVTRFCEGQRAPASAYNSVARGKTQPIDAWIAADNKLTDVDGILETLHD